MDLLIISVSLHYCEQVCIYIYVIIFQTLTQGSSGAGEGFEVTKYGHGRVALIGFPRSVISVTYTSVFSSTPTPTPTHPVKKNTKTFLDIKMMDEVLQP